jgi:hypothetical protein
VEFELLTKLLLLYGEEEIEIIIKDINIEVCNYNEKLLPLSVYQNNIVIISKFDNDIYLKLSEMSKHFNDLTKFKFEKDLCIVKDTTMLVCHQPIIENIKIRYDQYIEVNIISGFIEKKESDMIIRNVKLKRLIKNINENN